MILPCNRHIIQSPIKLKENTREGKDQITIEKPAANILKAGVPEVQNPQTILMFCRKIDRERQKLSVRAPEN